MSTKAFPIDFNAPLTNIKNRCVFFVDTGKGAVEVSLENEKLVIVVVPESKLTLRRLLAQVTKDNRHSEFDTGTAIGSEVW